MARDESLDLVCGIQVPEENRHIFSEYGGHTYRFCSPECKRKFDDHPDYFVQKQAKVELGL